MSTHNVMAEQKIGSYSQLYPLASRPVWHAANGFYTDAESAWWFPTEDEDLVGPYVTLERATEAYEEYFSQL